MIIKVILMVITFYLICGFVFAIAFVIKGVSKVDEGAHGSTFGFRIIIIPGTVIFWPLLFRKWLNANKESHHD